VRCNGIIALAGQMAILDVGPDFQLVKQELQKASGHLGSRHFGHRISQRGEVMREELLNLLTSYFMRWKSISNCAEWFAGVDWDDPQLDQQTKTDAGRLELLVTEVLEGIRPESDFWKEASAMVARDTGFDYGQLCCDIVVACSAANDNADWSTDLIVQDLGQASQSWSISPLPVSA